LWIVPGQTAETSGIEWVWQSSAPDGRRCRPQRRGG